MTPALNGRRPTALPGPSEIPSFIPEEEMPRPPEYTTSEAAEKVGVSTATLRRWEERLADLVAVERNRRGHRIYTEAAVDTFRELHWLREECGLTLEGARRVLQLPTSRERSVAREMARRYGREVTPLLARLIAEVGDVPKAAALLDRENGAQTNGDVPALTRVGTRLHGEKRDREVLTRIRGLQKRRRGEPGWLARLLGCC